ncbi:dUTP diphosphatase [Fusobacterium pseudoperiodonticum]|uniref:dUTP diphosphatase n=1 Tax=Fusobacterium pseudoperiodonticum TaxID=2663009 RepID=A0AAD0F0Y5_9FUSO|nr:dUTP diphosphatase [Fusobacterium pseudoperiodonticum]ATV35931.1 dUTP diphosphatase [Fusobacterium pseudoperiodonticum]ATV61175.1 dUTP diphosphatase [Fusobacterium pseudoperiodonticum]
MEIKKPKNFKNILSLQKHLDNNINNVRDRTFEDIQMSLIAECVEFNEETMLSHKTWKVKPYNKEKELEELTDIYFFFAQLLNYLDDEKNKELKYVICYSFDEQYISTNEPHLLKFIHYVYTEKLAIAMDELNAITYQHNYTTQNILDCYWEKWQKNMKRIGKEWN